MGMTKRVVAIDDATLKAAQAALGTRTLKATVNTALRRVSDERHKIIEQRLDTLARIPFTDREDSWR